LGLNLETTHKAIVNIYGDGTARRLFEGARIFDFTNVAPSSPANPVTPFDSRKRAAGDDS
jgi:hypothetical protein